LKRAGTLNGETNKRASVKYFMSRFFYRELFDKRILEKKSAGFLQSRHLNE